MSHKVDLVVATEARLNKLQAFSTLLNGYEKFISLIQPRGGGGEGVIVVLRKNLDLETRAVSVDPEGRLVVFDVTHNSDKVFRLVAVYAPC